MNKNLKIKFGQCTVSLLTVFIFIAVTAVISTELTASASYETNVSQPLTSVMLDEPETVENGARTWEVQPFEIRGVFTGTVSISVNTGNAAEFAYESDCGGINLNMTRNISGTLLAIYDVEEMTAAEILEFLNNSLYITGDDAFSAVVDMIYISGKYTPFILTLGTDGELNCDNGTVTVEGSPLPAPGLGELNVTLSPDDGFYVSGYTIVAASDSGKVLKEEKFIGSGDQALTVTLSENAVIYPAFAEIGEEPDYTAERTAGNLKWESETVKISYKDALDFDFSAVLEAGIILDDLFTAPWSLGKDSISPPDIHMEAQFADGKTISKDTTIEKLDEKSGAEPGGEISIASGIAPENILPGKFTQLVTADYYTADSLCENHAYHANGIDYHKDGISRIIIIEKDGLTISGIHDDYTYSDDLSITPVLTPDSHGVKGSQAAVNADLIDISFTDKDGNATSKPTAAGKYVCTVTYSGDEYIAPAVFMKDVTIIKAENHSTPVKAVISNVTHDSLTVINAVDGQEYSADNGETWISGKAAAGGLLTISGLKQGGEYEVITRIAETGAYMASGSTASLPVKIHVLMTGVAESKNMPVTVEFKSTDGAVYSCVTDMAGNYAIALPGGNYYVSFTDKTGTSSPLKDTVTASPDGLMPFVALVTADDGETGTELPDEDADSRDEQLSGDIHDAQPAKQTGGDPQTGDDNNLLLFVVLLVISAVGIAVVLIIMKRTKK